MSGLSFVDTNIFVYAYDGRDPERTEQASDFIASLVSDGLVISTQVVAEFCNVMLTKKGITMKPADLQLVIQDVLQQFVAHTPDAAFYNRAVKLYTELASNLSFYDSLIVQAALDLNCHKLYSEDMKHGQKIGPITIINPFTSNL